MLRPRTDILRRWDQPTGPILMIMIKQGFRPGDAAFGDLPDRIKIAGFIVAAAVKAAAAVQTFTGDGDHAAANLKHRPAADLPVEPCRAASIRASATSSAVSPAASSSAAVSAS